MREGGRSNFDWSQHWGIFPYISRKQKGKQRNWKVFKTKIYSWKCKDIACKSSFSSLTIQSTLCGQASLWICNQEPSLLFAKWCFLWHNKIQCWNNSIWFVSITKKIPVSVQARPKLASCRWMGLDESKLLDRTSYVLNWNWIHMIYTEWRHSCK